MLKVCETFASIQGESSHAGKRCFFIRLAGCNLRCAWCDTAYAQAPETGVDATVEELLAAAKSSGIGLVEITGGEPLCQKESVALMRRLLESGFAVLLETNGSMPLDEVPEGVLKIVDCKCPSSGEAEKTRFDQYEKLTRRDEIKFVLADRNDYLYARDVVSHYRLAEKVDNILFSTVFGRVAPETVVNWIMEDALPVRFQLQMHKFIWPPDRRGV